MHKIATLAVPLHNARHRRYGLSLLPNPSFADLVLNESELDSCR